MNKNFPAPKVVRLAFAAVLAVLLGTIVYYSVINNSPLPYHPLVDGWNDVILHVGAFGLLTFVSLMIWCPTRVLFLNLLCVGGAIEFLQIFVPTREVDPLDLMSNAFGIAFAFGGFLAVRRFIALFTPAPSVSGD